MDEKAFGEFLTEFASWENWKRDNTKIDQFFEQEFSHTQISDMCSVALRNMMPSAIIGKMVSRLPLTDGHIDILLTSKWDTDIAEVFDNRPIMTPAQIEFGLNHEDVLCRDAAYNHPCCTDEMRIKHNLKFG